MKRIYLFLIISFLLASCGPVSKVQEIKGEIYQFGIYKTLGRIHFEDMASSPSGKNLYSEGGVQLVKQTTDIPLIFDTQFGVDYRLSGLPDVEELTIKSVINHPPIIRPSGAITNSFNFTVKVRPDSGSYQNGDSYKMNHDYELVEGNWTFSYYYQDNLLFSKTFNVSRRHAL